MTIQIFTPIESMNPLYLGASENLYEDVIEEHNGSTLAEIKEDGYRMQLHKKGKKVMAFTRSMNPIILELFPELNESIKQLPDCILDAELVGDNRVGHQGFDSVKRRFRHNISEKSLEEYLSSEMITEMPLALKVFDTLYWKDKELINCPLKERRKYTENISKNKISCSTQRLITDSAELKSWFEELVERNYEGLVCKDAESKYLPGTKTRAWIKLKRSETLDLAVLGTYYEGDEVSHILCGTYNKETGMFETLAKVNAKRENMNKELEAMLLDNYRKTIPKNILLNPKARKDRLPDYFLSPVKVVVEVAAMNFNYGKNWHSCGLEDGNSYSTRIGWLRNIRYDKSAEQTSTVEQVKKLYKNERQEK